jgi:DNA-binding CsgD family transcriptional regulator
VPYAYAPTTQASAWQSSRASRKHTTGPSPSPRGPKAGSAWRRGVEALTPSELRVIQLAATGRSNREIAHELYVTLKKVEGHLSRAYRKLAIEGRDQLNRDLEEKTGVPTL